MTPPQTRSPCAATSSQDPAIRIEKGLTTYRARRRSRLRRVIPLELPPLLGECFGLTANVRPLDREIQYRTRLFAGLQQTQCGEHNAALQIAMKGRAKVMTHRPGKKQCTRNFDCLRSVARYSDGNRGYTTRFNGSLNQSDGLMTDRSSGRQ